MMMCQCRLITCNQCTTLVSKVGNRGGFAQVGQEAYGEFLCLPLSFVLNLKLLLKNKVFKQMCCTPAMALTLG